MIVRERIHWTRMLFAWHGSVLPRILPQLLVITGFSFVVLFLQSTRFGRLFAVSPTIFTLIGISLAIFVGFCNTASYDRYWEGRKLWGSLVNETRSLVRETMAWMPGLSPEDQQHFARLNAAFAWALNDELRKKDSKNLQRLLSPAEMDAIEKKYFKPVAILDLMANWLAVKHREGLIDSMQLSATDKRLSVMSEIVGGCERILNTPLPFAYHVLLHRVVYIYCFLLPFGLLEVLHWMMPFLVMFISYTFISLDAIVDDIGEPFGEAANDLALNSICRTIEYSVFEQTGVAQAPLQQPTSHFID